MFLAPILAFKMESVGEIDAHDMMYPYRRLGYISGRRQENLCYRNVDVSQVNLF